MIVRVGSVDQHRRWLAQVRDHEITLAVSIEINTGQSTAEMLSSPVTRWIIDVDPAQNARPGCRTAVLVVRTARQS